MTYAGGFTKSNVQRYDARVRFTGDGYVLETRTLAFDGSQEPWVVAASDSNVLPLYATLRGLYHQAERQEFWSDNIYEGVKKGA